MEQENTDCFSEASVDDLMRVVFQKLLLSADAITATKGDFTEMPGVLLEITNPRARISRTDARGTFFSCLGEFLWYMAASNDLNFIQYYINSYHEYSDDRSTLHGAYGPRLFADLANGEKQLDNIIMLLKSKPTSRQAVIQLYDKEDVAIQTKDVPCTCTMQFLVRNERLHMFVSMRSNDAFKGLPHDVFAFTMMQELVARSLDLEMGTYKHFVGSLHLYYIDREKAASFLDEGWPSNIDMPRIPNGDPWASLSTVLHMENVIRNGKACNLSSLELDDYWLDIIRLLQIYYYYTVGDISSIKNVHNEITVSSYKPYIDKKCEKIMGKCDR